MDSRNETDRGEVTLPADLTFNADGLARFTDICQRNKLPPKDAQALLDLAAGASRQGGRNSTDKANREFAEARAGWRAAVFSDPEIGLDNAAQAKADSVRARAAFGSAELDQIFDSGWGDHPALVRFCVRVGRFHRETSEAHQPSSPAEAEANV